MRNKLTLIAALLGSHIVVSGCSDPTSASTSNYRAVIEQHFEQREDFPHCFFNYSFPAEFVGERQLAFSGVQNKLKLLHEIGLLDYRTKTIGEEYGNPKNIHGFNVSEEGQQYFSEENGFCIGKPKLLDLQDVSKPYEERGKTYVRGTYTWTVELPDWAMEPRFYDSEEFSSRLIYIRFEKIAAGEPQDDYFTLTLNDDGWGI